MLRRAAAAFLSIAIALLLTAAPASADGHARPDPSVLHVSGTAQVSAAPDEMYLVVSVVTEDERASDAMRENSRRTQAVIDALTRLGLNEKEATTQGVSVQPVYNRPQRGEAREIVGYRVANAVQVETLKLEKAGEYIGASIEAGANQVQSLMFRLSEAKRRVVRQDAIREATSQARAEAKTLASALGVTLMKVKSVSVGGGGGYPRPMAMARGMADVQMEAVPVNPGDVDLAVTVNLTYVIDGAAG